MGTRYMICAAHLAAIVRDLASNAENEAITVKTVENLDWEYACAYCQAPAEFAVSYYESVKTTSRTVSRTTRTT